MKTIMNYYQKTTILLCSLIILVLSGCSDSSLSPINLFSSSQDVEFGAQVDTTIRNNSKEYPIYNNADATKYLQDIVNEIKKSSLIKYAGSFPYKVTIIKNDTTVNAFATPGGYIYVYTGLLKYLDNEASLAAILAHEMAHADLRHSTNRMTTQYGVEFILNAVFGTDQSFIQQLGTSLFTNLYFLKNSRDDEYQADEYSFKYLQSTIWYPGAAKFFFEKANSNKNESFLATMLSTHPLDQDRIAALNKLINDAGLANPSEANLFTQRYTNFKNSLQ